MFLWNVEYANTLLVFRTQALWRNLISLAIEADEEKVVYQHCAKDHCSESSEGTDVGGIVSKQMVKAYYFNPIEDGQVGGDEAHNQRA